MAWNAVRPKCEETQVREVSKGETAQQSEDNGRVSVQKGDSSRKCREGSVCKLL